MLPGLRVSGFVFPELHLVEVGTGLGECIQVLLSADFVPVAAQEGLHNSRIFNFHHHGFGLAILGVVPGNVDGDEVRQAVFAVKDNTFLNPFVIKSMSSSS